MLRYTCSSISEAKIKDYTQHQTDLKILKNFVRKYCPKEYHSIFKNAEKENYASYVYNISKEMRTKDYKKKITQEEFCDYLKKKLKNIQCDKEDQAIYQDMMLRLETYTFMPKQVTGDNRVIPYQLYYDELKKILENAENYLPFLKESDEQGISNKSKLLSIFEFRIPYYVGPLCEASKYAWLTRKAEGKTYPWNFENKVDLDQSEDEFINRMTNNCSYLPGETVLPQNSLLYSKFTVLNEINNIKINGNPISVDCKQEIYRLFEENKKVTVDKIKKYLISNSYMKKEDVLGGVDVTIKSFLKPQHDFKRLLRSGTLNEGEVGYETAMRWTKGKHAFIVATHIDKSHVHNHIIYNSTSLDATRKFKNFFLSGLAVQRLSDMVCLEHGLSIITPKPYRERQKRTVYPKKRTQRDELCDAIDAVLKQKPKSFDGFVQALTDMGFEFKDGKQPAFKGKNQKRFIRLRSLGEGYSKEEIQAVISGKNLHKSKGSSVKAPAPKQFQMLIDIQAKMAEGKTIGYEKWAKKFNRKETARTVILLKEKGLGNYDDLTAHIENLSARFDALSDSIKAAEKRMVEVQALQQHIKNYRNTRQIYIEYRKSGYSKKFFEEHRQEITIHKAAKQAFDELQITKLPSSQSLYEEFHQLAVQKKQDYAE